MKPNRISAPKFAPHIFKGIAWGFSSVPGAGVRVTYRNALGYIEWRTNYKKKTGQTVGGNTAIIE